MVDRTRTDVMFARPLRWQAAVAVLALLISAVAAAIPPPPLVDPGLLVAPRQTERASWTFLEALADFPMPAIAPVDRPELTPEVQDEAYRRFLRGRDAALRGLHLRAVTEFEQARALDPGSVEIIRELAQSYAANGNTAKGLELYGALLAIDPLNPEALFTLGLAAEQQGDAADAIAHLGAPYRAGRTFTHDPAADAIAYFHLHEALLRLGYDRAAQDAAVSCLEVTLPPTMVSSYRQRYAMQRRQAPRLRAAIGDAACRRGAFEEAADAYRTLAADGAGDPIGVAARRIYVAAVMGDHEAAARLWLDVVEQTQEGADRAALVRLGAYVRRYAPVPTLPRAIDDRLLDQDDDVLAWRLRASVREDRAAIAVLESAGRRAPDDRGVARDLTERLARFDLMAAIDAVGARLDARPWDPADVVTPLARVWPRGRQVDAPARSAREAVVRAQVMLQRWAPGRAWAYLNEARQRWPDDAGVRRAVLEVASMLDEPRLLDPLLQEADAIDDASTRLTMAEALRRAERWEDAMEAARQAVNGAESVDLEYAAWISLLRSHIGFMESRPVDASRAAAMDAIDRLLEDVLREFPQRDVAYAEALRLYLRPSSGREPREIRQLTQRLATAAPDSRLYRRLVVQDLLRRGDLAPGLARCLRLIAADPTDQEAIGLAISAWERDGRSDVGVQWLERFCADVNDPVAFDATVRLLLRRGEPALARAFLADRQADDDTAVRRLLELVAQLTGDAEEEYRLGEARLLERPAGTRRALQRAVLLVRTDRRFEALDRLQWLANRADDAAPRHLIGAIGLAQQLGPTTPDAAPVVAALVEALARRPEPVDLSVYAVGLLSLWSLEGDGPSFERLATEAARRANNVADGSVRAVVAWNDVAARFVGIDAPAGAGTALRYKLRATPPEDADALALMLRMIFLVDAVSPGGVATTIDLLESMSDQIATLADVSSSQALSDSLLSASNQYSFVGNDAGAERLLRTAVALDDENGMAMNNLGYLLIERGEDGPYATGLIERAIQFFPDDVSVRDTVGWLRYKQGVFEDAPDGVAGALTWLEPVVRETNRTNPEVLDHYGDALWRVGRTAEAVEQWRAALEVVRDEGRVRQVKQSLRDQLLNLLVADPGTLYDQQFGVIERRLEAKVAAAEAGGNPPVAPTFNETQADDGRSNPSFP